MAGTQNKRSRYSKAFKTQVIAQCAQSGVSIEQVAMSHGLNASMVHHWRRTSTGDLPAGARASSGGEFISLPVLSSVESPSIGEIHIVLRRGGTAFDVHWPVSGANSCAQWLREWLC